MMNKEAERLHKKLDGIAAGQQKISRTVNDLVLDPLRMSGRFDDLSGAMAELAGGQAQLEAKLDQLATLLHTVSLQLDRGR